MTLKCSETGNPAKLSQIDFLWFLKHLRIYIYIGGKRSEITTWVSHSLNYQVTDDWWSRVFYLVFLRSGGFSLWRQVETSADLLFRSMLLSAFMVASFFNEHLLWLVRRLLCCEIIDHIMLKFCFLRFRSHTWLDNSVSFLCASWLNDFI